MTEAQAVEAPQTPTREDIAKMIPRGQVVELAASCELCQQEVGGQYLCRIDLPPVQGEEHMPRHWLGVLCPDCASTKAEAEKAAAKAQLAANEAARIANEIAQAGNS